MMAYQLLLPVLVPPTSAQKIKLCRIDNIPALSPAHTLFLTGKKKLSFNPPLNKQKTVRSFFVSAKHESKQSKEQILEALREELPAMFEPGANVDYSIYAKTVHFQDPLNDFVGIDKYRGNISFLQTFFKDSKLDLHGIALGKYKDGRDMVISRWTLAMTAPLPWSPRLAFTGTSEYVLDDSGAVVEHVDKWDSLPGQEKSAAKGVLDLLSQMFSSGSGAPVQPSDPQQPPYLLVRRYPAFEIRSYSPCVVVQTPYTSRPAAYAALDDYLVGANSIARILPRTSPVVMQVPSSSSPPSPSAPPKLMSYFLPSRYTDASAAPVPTSPDMCLASFGSRPVAVAQFSGSATPEAVMFHRRALLRELEKGGWAVAAGEDSIIRFAQYDAIYSLPWNRRNEVWVLLDDPTVNDPFR
uniref:SOUL heme-binding protein n=1 Tax=Cyanoptyche gloeocystis TaxID=77922 RepID=A0A7S2NPD6_9EUKA|mmetsp:Transcript_2005/g.3765  ORF Transcript_2005/g.3765 Transcript_2005/m.3765 type:complete len:411 (+) Transcript_2005:25-1257(+)